MAYDDRERETIDMTQTPFGTIEIDKVTKPTVAYAAWLHVKGSDEIKQIVDESGDLDFVREMAAIWCSEEEKATAK